MSSAKDCCEICNQQKFKYTCPKCNIAYCSVTCYRSQAHLQCSEEFYKSCIQEELTAAEPNSYESVRKIYDILKRIREFDAGFQPTDFEDGLELDSDDDAAEEEEEDYEVDDEDNENDEDLAARLENTDLNDADEVWASLTDAERKDFQKMVETGDIMKLLPDYKPWWCKKKICKIVEIPDKKKKIISNDESAIPQIKENIPLFSNISKKKPSSCIHYNLWNIITAYTCTVRFFHGGHLNIPAEAAAQLVNLSSTLKYGTNFEDVENAIISVEMEALTSGQATGNEFRGSSEANTTKPVLVQSREQLQNDARDIMLSRHHKLAALSDIHQLFKLDKEEMKKDKLKHAEFQKLFAMSSGSIVLDRLKLDLLIKKMEFFLSYVKSDEDLK